MTRSITRLAFVGSLAVGLALPLSLGSSALADPSNGDTFTLTCGNTSYDVVVSPGSGEWTPAHDQNSNRTFIPHAFTGFVGDVYDTEGNLVDHFEDSESQTQGSGKQKSDVACTYTFEFVNDGSDPEFPVGYTFVGSGGVTGQISGRK
jgi:hypothetical protein